MKRLTKKRLWWIAALTAFPLNAVIGDWHADKFGGHPWRADLADRLDAQEETDGD